MQPNENIFSDWRRWIALAGLLSAATLSVAAAPVRVTTWSLPSSETDGATNLVVQSAAVLKKLNPDVILLQDVPDWQTCNDLAAALKPANYKVAICSSFRDARTGKLSHEQTAILSKATAYISWAEAWQGDGQNVIGGGFAFAAIRVGGKSIGFFCVEPDRGGHGDISAQLLKQIDLLRNWTANKVQAHLVGGSFAGGDTTNLPAQLLSAGFADAFGALPDRGGQPDNATDLIFVRELGRALGAPTAPEATLAHSPVTIELDLSAPPIATPMKIAAVPKPAPISTPLTNATNITRESTPAVSQAAAPLIAKSNNWWMAAYAAGALLLVAIIWRVSRRSDARGRAVVTRQPLTTVTTASSGGTADSPTVINIDATGAAQTPAQHWQQRAEAAECRAAEATAALQTGVLPQLTRWLREKFVRRLTTDRALLLETQRTAAIKMLAVDERLAKVERELKDRYRVYERRIDELLKELAVARGENRELIRARIELLKAEMEKERARAGHSQPG